MIPKPRTPSLAALLAALALVLATAAPVHAAAEQSTTAKTRDLNPGMSQILERKAELGLTPDQESRLQQIRKDLAEKNKPLVAQVESVIGVRASREKMKAMSDSEREEYVMARAAEGKSHQELQPVYKQIRENRKAAWQQAKTVLNPDQAAKVEQWAKEKQKEMQAKAKAQGEGKSKSKGAPPSASPEAESKESAEHGKSGH
jgi:Spy/CpxP family protein refolding chaperone